MRIIFIFIFQWVILVSQVSAALSPGKPASPSTWVFFDLGMTLVTHDKKLTEVKYMPGAFNYIKALKAKGYKLGMIINLPDSWGMFSSARLKKLKEIINLGWKDKSPMLWKEFEVILVPENNSQRKPAPHMFLEAIKHAQGSVVTFQGESKEEVKRAKELGMSAYLVGAKGKSFFKPISKFKNLKRKNDDF